MNTFTSTYKLSGACLATLMAATAFGQWTQVPGAAINGPVLCPAAGWNCSAQAIAVGPNAGGFTTAWVLGTAHNAQGDYYIYQWNNYEWVQMPGAGTQLAVSPQGYPWQLNHAGQIYFWNGGSWINVPGCATSISVGPAAAVYNGGASPAPNTYGSQYGDPWIIGCEGTVYQLQGAKWAPQATQVCTNPSGCYPPVCNQAGDCSGSPLPPIQIPAKIAVSPQGVPWIMNSAGNVYYFNQSWDEYFQAGSCAVDIAVGPGEAWVVGCGSSGAGYGIWRATIPGNGLPNGGLQWGLVAGTASQISVSPDQGIPWVVNYFGQIYQP
jgi:hypothetical protein